MEAGTPYVGVAMVARVSASEIDVVRAFNEAINSRDAVGLEQLMSTDHRFVDVAGGTVSGKDACAGAWVSFFESFPDYRNIFESIQVIAPGEVRMDGHSTCSFQPLAGPAHWYAKVIDGLISEWRVEEPPIRP